MAQQTDVLPNLWELSGDYDTQITYSSSSVSGEPQFAYSGPKGEHSYSGEEIDTQETALGTEVTATLEDVGDVHLMTLTLLLPQMWIAPHSGMEVKTIAIFTDKDEPITASAGLPPARERYAVVNLQGEGKQVDF